MNDWTGAQVLEWLGLLGLPDDSVVTVRAVFSKVEIEGDDLEELGQNFLAKQLKRQGLDAAASSSLAELVISLRDQALQGSGGGGGGGDETPRDRVQLAHQQLQVHTSPTRDRLALVYFAFSHHPMRASQTVQFMPCAHRKAVNLRRA